jgi:hypothetical protein
MLAEIQGEPPLTSVSPNPIDALGPKIPQDHFQDSLLVQLCIDKHTLCESKTRIHQWLRAGSNTRTFQCYAIILYISHMRCYCHLSLLTQMCMVVTLPKQISCFVLAVLASYHPSHLEEGPGGSKMPYVLFLFVLAAWLRSQGTGRV